MATSIITTPSLTNAILLDIPAINNVLKALAKVDPSTLEGFEAGTKRIVEGANGWEIHQFDGTSWGVLSKFNIDAQTVDGYNTSTSATKNTIPVRNANGAIPGNITGNAASITETLPINKGGTNATDSATARNNLGAAPTSHASSENTYGVGNASNYGHLKLTNTVSSDLDTADGCALTPAGAKTELDKTVHKTGAETIAGAKTFAATPKIEGSKPSLIFTNTALTKGTTPGADQSFVIELTDKAGSGAANRVGALASLVSTNNVARTELRAYEPVAGSSKNALLTVSFPAGGAPYGSAPSTPAGSAGTQIVTADFLAAQGGIGGVAKTLGNTDAATILTPGFYYLSGADTGLPSGTNGYLMVIASALDGTGITRQLFWRAGTINSNDHAFYMRQRAGGTSTTWGDWVQVMTSKGGTFTGNIQAPTPAKGNVSQRVVTTEFLNNAGLLCPTQIPSIKLQDTTNFPDYENNFDKIRTPGRYHVLWDSTTLKTPFTTETYSDGVLEVIRIGAATGVSSYARLLQRITIFGGGKHRGFVFSRTTTTANSTGSFYAWTQEAMFSEDGKLTFPNGAQFWVE